MTLLARLLKGITYEEIVLVGGISNTLYMAPYGNAEIYIANGRGFDLIDELLDKLEVPYKELNQEQVEQLDKEQYKDVLMVTPYEAIKHTEKINPAVVQFFNNYTTYQLADINEEHYVFEQIQDLETEITKVSREEINFIRNLKVKPLDVSLKFFWIDSEQPFTEAKKKELIKKALDQLTTSEEMVKQNGKWWKGPVFYDRLEKEIHGWNACENKVIKHVLMVSLLSGSSFFYRKEFCQALEQSGQEIEQCVVDALEKSGHLWRDLGRCLKGHLMHGRDIENQRITKILTSLQENEIQSFGSLRKMYA